MTYNIYNKQTNFIQTKYDIIWIIYINKENMKLKIYTNQSNQLIYINNNINELLELYNINKNSEKFQELFETEILNDIFENEKISSSYVYYELIK